MTINIIDLNRFPLIENSIGLIAFNHFNEFPRLQNLGDITQRIYGCSSFLYYRIDEKNKFLKESASLRAALNEFASLSEMLKESLNPNLNSLTIDKLDYPLFHFFKLLRVVNFHLKSLKHNTTTLKVKNFNTVSGAIDDDIITLEPVIIENLNISIFELSKNMKYYDKTQIESIIKWTNTNQLHWGIFHLLDLALRQYCSLIERYCY